MMIKRGEYKSPSFGIDRIKVYACILKFIVGVYHPLVVKSLAVLIVNFAEY